jgi:hypothetical protein
MWIASTHSPQPVPLADASGERSVNPETTLIPAASFTVPIVTNHCEAVTVFGSSAGAGSLEIYNRPAEGAPWTLLATLAFAGVDTQSERLQCPTGHLRCKAVGANMTAYVHGLVKK